MLRVIVLALSLLGVGAFEFHTDTNRGLFVDGQGRRRVFHGVNAVEKVAPFLPTTGETNTLNSLNAEDAALLKSWGFNVVRLGVMWPAVTPSPGVVNTTYLSEVKKMMGVLAEAGVYTLVDLHQDVWSPYLCGEGMPDYVFEEAMELAGFDRSGKRAFPAPLSWDIPTGADGYPEASACQNHSFFPYYMTWESEALWGALYSEPSIWAHLGDHWEAVASHLADADGLLGYELINEPWPARGVNGSWHFLSDSDTLLPLYEYLHSRIRSVDDDALFFFEPLVLESYLSMVRKYTNFPEGGPGGLDYANRSVYAYHSYCSNDADGTPKPMWLCRAIIHSGWGSVETDLDALKVGGFLTEFGAVGDDDDSLKLIELQTKGADDLFQSWAYWTFKSFDDITTQNPATETFYYPDGTLQTSKVKALSRAYAPIVAGEPGSMSFDPDTSAFSLSYTVDLPSTATSEVFLPTGFYYPSGYTVETSEGVTWEVAEQGDDWAMLRLTHADDLAAGSTVTVSVTAASA